jgi:hypothetical protein
LTDFSFEIDDQGMPYWVVTKYEKRIGFSGNEAVGVVLVNAQTGAIKNIQLTPKWVDRIQPINFIENQLNDWENMCMGTGIFECKQTSNYRRFDISIRR